MPLISAFRKQSHADLSSRSVYRTSSKTARPRQWTCNRTKEACSSPKSSSSGQLGSRLESPFDQDVEMLALLAPSLPAWWHASHHDDNRLKLQNGTPAPNKCFPLYELLWSWCRFTAINPKHRQHIAITLFKNLEREQKSRIRTATQHRQM